MEIWTCLYWENQTTDAEMQIVGVFDSLSKAIHHCLKRVDEKFEVQESQQGFWVVNPELDEFNYGYYIQKFNVNKED